MYQTDRQATGKVFPKWLSASLVLLVAFCFAGTTIIYGGHFSMGGHFSISHTLNKDSPGIYSTGWAHYPTAWDHYSTWNNDRGSFFYVE